MANLKLDILVIPTLSSKTIGINDISTYPLSPPIQAPSIKITVPGFSPIFLPFTPNDFNVFNSGSLELTTLGEDLSPIPDGIYEITYSVIPAYLNFVTKSIMRVDQIQEKFDSAFMKLDMMECDIAVKKQQKIDLNTIYFLIQGSIASANKCDINTSEKLYRQANKLLDNFIKGDCGCSGNNYIPSFY